MVSLTLNDILLLNGPMFAHWADLRNAAKMRTSSSSLLGFSPLRFQRRDTDLGLAISYIFICEAGFLGVNGLLPKRA